MSLHILKKSYQYKTNEAIQIQKMIYSNFNISDITYFIDKYYNIIINELYGFLFDSILQNNLELIEILINKYKIDVNIKTNANSTPIMYAAYIGNFKIVKYLYEKGAKLSYKNNYGNDVYYYANKEITDYLCNKQNMYIILLIEESQVYIHNVIVSSKDNLGLYIKNNIQKLMKYFIAMFNCNTIISNIKKYINYCHFSVINNNSKVSYLYDVFNTLNNKEIVNGFNGYNLLPYKLIKIYKLKNS